MEQTQKQRMLAGQHYHAGDPEIQADQQSAKPIIHAILWCDGRERSSAGRL